MEVKGVMVTVVASFGTTDVAAVPPALMIHHYPCCKVDDVPQTALDGS